MTISKRLADRIADAAVRMYWGLKPKPIRKRRTVRKVEQGNMPGVAK
jgi:hypothetical protein